MKSKQVLTTRLAQLLQQLQGTPTDRSDQVQNLSPELMQALNKALTSQGSSLSEFTHAFLATYLIDNAWLQESIGDSRSQQTPMAKSSTPATDVSDIVMALESPPPTTRLRSHLNRPIRTRLAQPQGTKYPPLALPPIALGHPSDQWQKVWTAQKEPLSKIIYKANRKVKVLGSKRLNPSTYYINKNLPFPLRIATLSPMELTSASEPALALHRLKYDKNRPLKDRQLTQDIGAALRWSGFHNLGQAPSNERGRRPAPVVPWPPRYTSKEEASPAHERRPLKPSSWGRPPDPKKGPNSSRLAHSQDKWQPLLQRLQSLEESWQQAPQSSRQEGEIDHEALNTYRRHLLADKPLNIKENNKDEQHSPGQTQREDHAHSLLYQLGVPPQEALARRRQRLSRQTSSQSTGKLAGSITAEVAGQLLSSLFEDEEAQ